MRERPAQRQVGPFDRSLWRGPLLVWAALSALLAVTVVLAYLPLGVVHVITAFGIGGAKALLIGLFFMQLRSASTQLRVASIAGLFWLSLLFLLSFADYLTRT